MSTNLAAENAELRARLAEAEKTLKALRSGAGGAPAATGPGGEQVSTLPGAETLYHLLMGSLNEGASTVSRERHHVLFELNPDGLFAVDTTGRFVVANPACEVISGYSADELRQKTFSEICAPDQLARTVEHFERGLREGKPQQFETALLRKDGRRVELWVAGELANVDQQPVLQCAVRDLTARKQAERDLFEANQRLQALMQALPVGVSFSDDATCQRITGNPAALAQFEVTAGDNLSASAPDASAPGRQVRFFRDGQPITDADLPLQRAVAENREIPPTELEVVLPSGRRWCTLASGAPIRDQQGGVVGGIAVTVDITERKQVEEALRLSEQRLKHAQQIGNIGSWEWDIETGALLWSDQVCRQFGEEPGRFTPTHDAFLQRIHPEDRPTFEAAIQRTLAGNAPYDLEFRILRPDGAVRLLHGRGEVLPGPEGKPRRMLGVCQDITERQQAEVALRESEAGRKVAEAVQAEQQRLREMMNMLPAYVVLLSPDYHVPFANRFFEERFGRSEGRRCYEYLFNRAEPCADCRSYEALKQNAPQRWEWTGPDGRNYDIYDFPFRDADGSPLILEVGMDITERKQAEAELIKHREHLQELVHERTAELSAVNAELTRFNSAMVGRELRMIELKKEINALCADQGRPPAYPTQAEPKEPGTPATS